MKYRDLTFIVGGLLFAVLMILGFMEQALVRRAQRSTKDLAVAIIGVAAAIFGVVTLHRTDSVNGNTLAGVVGLIGAVVAIVFYARGRFDGREKVVGSLPDESKKLLALWFAGCSCRKFLRATFRSQ